MRRLPAVLIAVASACLGLLAIGGAPQATPASATSSGGWGNAHRVPGVAALAPRGFAYAVSLSCASQANCTIGGWYTTRTGNRNLSQAFSVRDVNGAWKLPQRIPGLVVPAASFPTLSAFSCAAQGNCVAAGDPGSAWLGWSTRPAASGAGRGKFPAWRPSAEAARSARSTHCPAARLAGASPPETTGIRRTAFRTAAGR